MSYVVLKNGRPLTKRYPTLDKAQAYAMYMNIVNRRYGDQYIAIVDSPFGSGLFGSGLRGDK